MCRACSTHRNNVIWRDISEISGKKRPLGRPRNWWDDHIKVDLRDIERVHIEWDLLVQIKEWWKKFEFDNILKHPLDAESLLTAQEGLRSTQYYSSFLKHTRRISTIYAPYIHPSLPWHLSETYCELLMPCVIRFHEPWIILINSKWKIIWIFKNIVHFITISFQQIKIAFNRHSISCRQFNFYSFMKEPVRRMVSSGMLHRAALVRTVVSEEPSASFIRVTRIGELGTTQPATSNRRTLRRNWRLGG
jgi:hypothetical protein